MDNFIIVFRTIKENCKNVETPNEKCFAALEKQAINQQSFFSLYLCLEVLQSLGLIKFNAYRKELVLTEKGKHTDYYSVFSTYAFLLVFLYFFRQVFLFIIFWPIFFMLGNPPAGRGKNSAG